MSEFSFQFLSFRFQIYDDQAIIIFQAFIISKQTLMRKLMRIKSQSVSQSSFKNEFKSSEKHLFPLLPITNRRSSQSQNVRVKLFKSKLLLKSIDQINLEDVKVDKIMKKPKLQAKKLSIKPINFLNKTQLYEKNVGRVTEYAWNSIQGTRNHNEDRVSINIDFEYNGKSYPYFAVFDGHGGSRTSQFLYNYCFKTFKKFIKLGNTIEQALINSLQEIQIKLQSFSKLSKYDNSGSCALICITDDQNIHIANIGDSRSLYLNTQQKTCKQITYDHKPQNQRQRIQSEGGKIYRINSELNDMPIGPYRIWPSKLAVSRTLGDCKLKSLSGDVISSTPDYFSRPISSNFILLLLTDGIYENFTNQQLSSLFFKNSLNQSIDRLLEKISLQDQADNSSIIAIKFN